MGVDCKEFWKLNPCKLKAHVQAYEIKEKKKIDEINFAGWLIGVYVTHALGCAFSQGLRYPEKPFDILGQEISKEERRKQEAALFAAYANEFNKQLKKEG